MLSFVCIRRSGTCKVSRHTPGAPAWHALMIQQHLRLQRLQHGRGDSTFCYAGQLTGCTAVHPAAQTTPNPALMAAAGPCAIRPEDRPFLLFPLASAHSSNQPDGSLLIGLMHDHIGHHLTRCVAASQLPSCSAAAHASIPAARAASKTLPTACVPSTVVCQTASSDASSDDVARHGSACGDHVAHLTALPIMSCLQPGGDSAHYCHM